MKVFDFDLKHIEAARILAVENYNEERIHIPELPEIQTFPDISDFAYNGLGVAAFDDDTDRMIGFLCCYSPWDNAFGSKVKGTFSPIHAHGAVKENRGNIYKRMYQAAAEKWVREKIASHAIAFYAHDIEALNSMFTYGFGLRCIDSIRPMENFTVPSCDSCYGIYFQELEKVDVIQVREMRRMLSEHLGNSPCFMHSSESEFSEWIARAESRDTRLFAAFKDNIPVAFIEISDGGETFVTEYPEMMNICGAFCIPEYRGQNIVQNLINYIISALKSEGYLTLGVDFESFNPTAMGFWSKHFSAYTNSVVRRIDERAVFD